MAVCCTSLGKTGYRICEAWRSVCLCTVYYITIVRNDPFPNRVKRTNVVFNMRRVRLQQQYQLDFQSSGILRNIRYFVTEVWGQPIFHIFKGQAVQGDLSDCLTLGTHYGKVVRKLWQRTIKRC
jgi:hypothetical protein